MSVCVRQASLAQVLAKVNHNLATATLAIDRIADKMEDSARASFEVNKAHVQQLEALVKQAELAVQWYAHSLSTAESAKTAKK